MRTPKVMQSCASRVGMSRATAASWDPGLWLYPLMQVHEEMAGDISTEEEDILEDDEGKFYFAKFDCGCEFYVPSTAIKATFNDGLPGDVAPDPPQFSQN
jgi:hypothetical protein